MSNAPLSLKRLQSDRRSMTGLVSLKSAKPVPGSIRVKACHFHQDGPCLLFMATDEILERSRAKQHPAVLLDAVRQPFEGECLPRSPASVCGLHQIENMATGSGIGNLAPVYSRAQFWVLPLISPLVAGAFYLVFPVRGNHVIPNSGPAHSVGLADCVQGLGLVIAARNQFLVGVLPLRRQVVVWVPRRDQTLTRRNANWRHATYYLR